TLEADFNNYGIEDLAVSGPSVEFGTGGGPWSLYLKVADRKYKKIGGFGAPRTVNLFTKEKGVGYMGAYWHMSGQSGGEMLFKITMNEFTEVKSVMVEWDAEGNERTVNRDERLPIPKGYTKTRLSAKAIEKEMLLGK
ncbi:MAG: hypothetical protein WC655_04035, partial [Candidatus Hydrogenedentales bacterium]